MCPVVLSKHNHICSEKTRLGQDRTEGKETRTGAVIAYIRGLSGRSSGLPAQPARQISLTIGQWVRGLRGKLYNSMEGTYVEQRLYAGGVLGGLSGRILDLNRLIVKDARNRTVPL